MDFTGKSIMPALNEMVMKKLIWVTLIGFFLLGLPIRAMSKDTDHGQADEKLKKMEQFRKIQAQTMRLQKLRQSEKYKGMDFDRLRSLPPEGIDSMIKKYQPGKGAKPIGAPASIKSAGDITYVPLTIDAQPVNGEIPSGEQDYYQFTDDGNIYVGGTSYSGWGNPLGPYNGGGDAFVAKLTGFGREQQNRLFHHEERNNGR